MPVQNPPDVDMVGLFGVEDKIGVAPQRPASQTGQVEVMRVAW